MIEHKLTEKEEMKALQIEDLILKMLDAIEPDPIIAEATLLKMITTIISFKSSDARHTILDMIKRASDELAKREEENE